MQTEGVKCRTDNAAFQVQSVRVCGIAVAEIAGSNPAEGLEVCLL